MSTIFDSILKSFALAGLHCRLIRSQGTIIACVRVSEQSLRAHANVLNFEVPLSSDALEKLSIKGLSKYNIKPFPIRDDPNETKIKPFAHIHGKYDMSDELQEIYGSDVHTHSGQLRLPALTRSKLILSLLEGLATEGHVGEAENLQDLISDDNSPLVAYFPLHDSLRRAEFSGRWLSWFYFPWNQPLEDVRNYFGEKIGMYFSFLGHYTTALVWLSFIGAVAFAFQLAQGWDPDNHSMPVLGVFVSMWAVLMMEFWKRKQQYIALRWGMLNFKKTENTRKEFVGTATESLVNGRLEIHFPRDQKRKRMWASIGVVFVMITIVVGAVISVYIVQHEAEKAGGFWADHASSVAGLLSAVQIQVMNLVYRGVAIKMTVNENHRTNTEYETSLVFKIFAFQLINSYSSLTYIAFIKDEDQCLESCMKELGTALMWIFVVGLLLSNIIETGLPWLVNKAQICWMSCHCCGGKAEKQAQCGSGDSAVFEYAVLDDYDVVLGQLDDYAELAIQFGYCTLFVVCFPLAPLLALITCWVEIRSDAYKFLNVNRRVLPCGAMNIGPWEHVFINISRLAVVTNGGLLCFTSDYLEDHFGITLIQCQHVFMIYIGVIFFFMYLIDKAIPDIPAEVEIQMKRQEFIVAKVIDHLPDDHNKVLAAAMRDKRKDEPYERPQIFGDE